MQQDSDRGKVKNMGNLTSKNNSGSNSAGDKEGESEKSINNSIMERSVQSTNPRVKELREKGLISIK